MSNITQIEKGVLPKEALCDQLETSLREVTATDKEYERTFWGFAQTMRDFFGPKPNDKALSAGVDIMEKETKEPIAKLEEIETKAREGLRLLLDTYGPEGCRAFLQNKAGLDTNLLPSSKEEQLAGKPSILVWLRLKAREEILPPWIEKTDGKEKKSSWQEIGIRYLLRDPVAVNKVKEELAGDRESALQAVSKNLREVLSWKDEGERLKGAPAFGRQPKIPFEAIYAMDRAAEYCLTKTLYEKIGARFPEKPAQV